MLLRARERCVFALGDASGMGLAQGLEGRQARVCRALPVAGG